MEARRCGSSLENLVPTYKGAEAYIYVIEWLGSKAIAKWRIPKSYRHIELDNSLRRKRTIDEAKIMLSALEAGVETPSIYFVDPDQALIIMEYVEGIVFSVLIEKEGCSERIKSIAKKLGESLAKLHKAGIAHGDITTSNVIVRDLTPVIIDFGLASKTRDLREFAIDIHLFLRSLESTHPEHVDCIFQSFIKGYEDVMGSEKTRDLLKIVKEIRLMGRYIEARRRQTVWQGV